MDELPDWQQEMCDLVDSDPGEAIKRARALARYKGPAKDTMDDFRSGILIDAGAVAPDTDAIREGIALLEGLIEKEPSEHRWYNRANGYAALVNCVGFEDAHWWLTTSNDRRSAREGYRRALTTNDCLLRARCWTNLGNELILSHRWVEAYDAYVEAISLDPTHGIALTGAVKVLLRAIRQGLGDPLVLKAVAARHLDIAKRHPERIRELAGLQAQQGLADLLRLELDPGMEPQKDFRDPYLQFVADHRLALSLTIEGLKADLARWDTLRLPGVVEPLSAGSDAPPIFAAFNALKSEYLAARYLAFLAIQDRLPESGDYVDTLDYANYGVSSAGLIIAQRAVLDLLDKIAVASCDHFSVNLPRQGVYFRRFWRVRESGRPGTWRGELAEEASSLNTGLVALTDLAEDLDDGGALVQHRILRDSATHRFIILHELGGRPGRESKFADHVDETTYRENLKESLRLSRAALVYFVDMVRQRSERKAKALGRVGQLYLPDHDWVRGRNTRKKPKKKRKPTKEKGRGSGPG